MLQNLEILLLEYKLILDDFKARKLAANLQLQFTGTLGVFLKAKEIGIIPSIKPVLKKYRKQILDSLKKLFQIF